MLLYLGILLLFGVGAITSLQSGRLQYVDSNQATGAGPQPNELRGNVLFLVAVSFAIIIVGLRDRVGVDWANYVQIFNSLKYDSLGDALYKTDPAYGFVNWLAVKLGFEIWFVNVVAACLLCWGIYRYAKTQPNPWLVFVVAVPYLIIVVGMNYVRQSVAIGMCLAGIGALIDRSLPKFLIYVAVGAMFHKTALIVLPIVSLSYTKNNLIRLVTVAAAVWIGYYTLFSTNAYDRLSELYVRSSMVSSGAITRLAMNIPPALLFLTMPNTFRFELTEKRIWSIYAWLALILFGIALFSTATTAFDRMGLYLIPLQLAVLGRLPNALSPNFTPQPVVTGGILLYATAVEFVFLSFSDYSRFWIPYKSYLF